MQEAQLEFGRSLIEYASKIGLNQKGLASLLGISAATLSRRLDPATGTFLTLSQVKQLIEVLAEKGALTTVNQAHELLHLLYPHYNFNKNELDLEPLSNLSMLPSDNKPVMKKGIKSIGLEVEMVAIPPLPMLFTPLIGRDRELEQVQLWLSGEGIRLVNVTGPGGIGKTTLALALARLVEDEYPDGVAWVDLTCVVVGAGTEALKKAILTGLGLSPQGEFKLEDQIKNFLIGKKLLLVLDNFEQLQTQENVLFVGRLLATLPQLQVIVTSREILVVGNGRVLPLMPLSYPAVQESLPVVGEIVERYSAVRLFVDRVKVLEPGFELTAENVSSVVELCRWLDGVPLAIAIAAGRVRQFGVGGVLEMVRQGAGLIVLADNRQREERHQSQSATIEWSYMLLAEEEKKIWRGLTVFVGSSGLDGIVGVLGNGLSAIEAATRYVGPLVDKSLLFKGESSRYYLHQIMREYGLARLTEQDEELDRVKELHANYYLGLVEEAAPKLVTAERAKWTERLSVEYGNIEAALEWFVGKGLVGEASRLAGAMGQFWYGTRRFGEGREWLERVLGLEGAGEIDQGVRAEALHQLGRMLLFLGKLNEARKASEESLAIWERSGDLEGEVKALIALGNIEYRLTYASQNFEIAKLLNNQALAIAEKIDYTYAKGHALTNLANIAMVEGENQTAKVFYQQALEVRQTLGDTEAATTILRNLGQLALQENDLREAEILTARVLRLYQQSNNQFGLVEVYLTLGRINQSLEDVGEAKHWYSEGLQQSLVCSYDKYVAYFLFMIMKLVAAQTDLTGEKLVNLARLVGIVEGLDVLDKHYFDEQELATYNELEILTRDNLDRAVFRQAQREGRASAEDLSSVVQASLKVLESIQPDPNGH